MWFTRVAALTGDAGAGSAACRTVFADQTTSRFGLADVLHHHHMFEPSHMHRHENAEHTGRSADRSACVRYRCKRCHMYAVQPPCVCRRPHLLAQLLLLLSTLCQGMNALMRCSIRSIYAAGLKALTCLPRLLLLLSRSPTCRSSSLTARFSAMLLFCSASSRSPGGSRGEHDKKMWYSRGSGVVDYVL